LPTCQIICLPYPERRRRHRLNRAVNRRCWLYPPSGEVHQINHQPPLLRPPPARSENADVRLPISRLLPAFNGLKVCCVYLKKIRQSRTWSYLQCLSLQQLLSTTIKWVGHEGVRCRRVQAPPGKLSVHPGSYPDSGLERSTC